MRITVIFDKSTWSIGDTGAFAVRYAAIFQRLIRDGHELNLVQLTYGGEKPGLEFPQATFRSIAVQAHPTSRVEKFLRIFLDVIAPHRQLPHGADLNRIVNETSPDVVIAVMARNPKVVRNLSRNIPILLFAEEDFSSAWDSTSKFGNLLRPLLALRNRALQRTWLQPHTVVVISDREHKWARRAFKDARIVTIPLFLPEERWLEEVAPIGKPMEIFAIGNYDALRNSFGLRKFLDELYELAPENTPVVHVACYFPLHPILDDVPTSRLEFIGRISDPRPYYYDAKICLSPSLSVSGAKNQILQGWATGCPVVASVQSAESVNGVDGEDLLIGGTPHELASAVIEALKNGELRQHLSANGKKSLMKHNSREKSLDLFVKEVVSLL